MSALASSSTFALTGRDDGGFRGCGDHLTRGDLPGSTVGMASLAWQAPACPSALSELRVCHAAAERVNAKVVEAACVIELPDLKGREKLGDLPLFVLIEKEGA